MPSLEYYKAGIAEIMESTGDDQEAHQQANAILVAMTKDGNCLGEILHLYLQQLATNEQAIGKAFRIGITIAKTARFGMNANIWFPCSSPYTKFSAVPIHHHGTVRLTTVTAFGPGYRHWLFETLPLRRLSSGRHRLRAIDVAQHPVSHSIFVDAHQPHVFRFPYELSVTYVLWSRPTSGIQSSPICSVFVPLGNVEITKPTTLPAEDAETTHVDFARAVSDVLLTTGNRDLAVEFAEQLRNKIRDSSDADNASRVLSILDGIAVQGRVASYAQSSLPWYCVNMDQVGEEIECDCAEDIK